MLFLIKCYILCIMELVYNSIILCIKSFKYTHIIGKKILEYIIDMLMLLLEISKWKS